MESSYIVRDEIVRVGGRMMRSVALFTIVLTMTTFGVCADEPRRDGNWWTDQSQCMKTAYVVGFFDGMELGNKFSYWGLTADQGETCNYFIVKSFNDHYSKFFSDITSGQLADGLDNFYSDYRNRRIKVADAIWLVTNSIVGTPHEELDKMIESWRRNSN